MAFNPYKYKKPPLALKKKKKAPQKCNRLRGLPCKKAVGVPRELWCDNCKKE